MIIDVHCHIGRGDFLNDQFQMDTGAEVILKQQQEANVDKTVIFPQKRIEYRTANEEISDFCKAHPSFIGFGRVAAAGDDAPEQVEYAVKELGLKGIKIHMMDGFPPTRKAMDKIEDLQVPVLFHTGMGTSPALFEPIAKTYPDVTVILAHCGTDLSWTHMLEYPEHAIRLAAEYEKVYVDTSAVYILDVLKRAAKVCGPSKMLFGSDGPMFHPAIAIRQIELLGLNENELNDVLGGNTAKILGN